MYHSRACRRCCDGRTAGIGKQIQHAHLPSRLRLPRTADECGKPIPVRRLLREKPRVLKAHRSQDEAQPVAVANVPLGGHRILHPRAAAG